MRKKAIARRKAPEKSREDRVIELCRALLGLLMYVFC